MIRVLGTGDMCFVTLMSDFGTRDGFASAMKGVVLSIAPEATVVDATHEIEPGDIEAAGWALLQYWRLYPAGSVHVAVVDPGVGGPRRAIALRAADRFIVAPDNGLLTDVLADAGSWRCVEIGEARYLRSPISNTFHGRDVFAPAAAHLAAGVELEALGPPAGGLLRLERRAPARGSGSVEGRVAHVDRFGNLITDIPGDWVDESWSVTIGDREVAVKRTYSDVEPGELLAVVGSLGTIEIAARDGSAARTVDAGRGDAVSGRRVRR